MVTFSKEKRTAVAHESLQGKIKSRHKIIELPPNEEETIIYTSIWQGGLTTVTLTGDWKMAKNEERRQELRGQGYRVIRPARFTERAFWMRN